MQPDHPQSQGIVMIVDDGELEVEIADGVRVRIVRGMIQDVRSKGEPVKN